MLTGALAFTLLTYAGRGAAVPAGAPVAQPVLSGENA